MSDWPWTTLGLGTPLIIVALTMAGAVFSKSNKPTERLEKLLKVIVRARSDDAGTEADRHDLEDRSLTRQPDRPENDCGGDGVAPSDERSG